MKITDNLFVYGYSRHWPHSTIGNAIYKVRNKHLSRFKIRFSNLTSDKFSASSSEVSTKGITCPVQLDKTDSCGTCGLCWTVTNKPIIFLTH